MRNELSDRDRRAEAYSKKCCRRKRRRRKANMFRMSALLLVVFLGVALGYFMTGQCKEPQGGVKAKNVFLGAQSITVQTFEEGKAVVENHTPLSDELYTVLLDACDTYGIPEHIALGVIEVESSFREDAISSAGCYGLMQLNPTYFPSDLSAEENIEAGIEYLAYQLERYGGDMAAALTGYNAGHDTGSRSYADKVLEAAQKYISGEIK